MRICSVGDFLKVVKELYPNDGRAFFRGQASSEFDVSSSIFRFISNNKPERSPDNYGYILSNRLFSEFKRSIPIYSEAKYLKDYSFNDLDVMMMAQHYGVPTRLVDWTRNPLVALYFATEQDCESENISVYMLRNKDGGRVSVINGPSFLDSVVAEQKRFKDIYDFLERIILRGYSLHEGLSQELNEIANRYSSFEAAFPSVQVHPEFNCAYTFSSAVRRLILDKRLAPGLPAIFTKLQDSLVNILAHPCTVSIYGSAQCIIEPLPINTRIKNQQGVFLFSKEINSPVYGAKDFNEENVVSSYDFGGICGVSESAGVVRVDIGREYVSEIHNELRLYGVTRDFIYPELPSFAQEMQRRVVGGLNFEFS